ncbi:MAG: nicotinate (nicotinamide) nucleotide adenylyltransferase [Desulfobacterales bacterium]|nr:MAG: nicotinate (nicotinamide) nucleotide adenylyltransferase [Desulfobacterales bacterium]
MRIGLFGGTFNPIHVGHLRAALEVKEEFALEKIFLIPAALPPHKERGHVVDAADRLQMIHLAVTPECGFSVSEVELRRTGISYTIDTVCHFKHILPAGTCLYLVMGLDAFLEIDSWKSYTDLLREVPLIVISRPAAAHPDPSSGWQTLGNYLQSKISAHYRFSASQSCYLHAQGNQPIHIFAVTALDISSTQIRKRIKQGRSIKFLVPEKVADYIQTRGLYL